MKNNKKVFMAFCVVILFAIVVIGLILYSHNKKNIKSLSESPAETTTVKQVANTTQSHQLQPTPVGDLLKRNEGTALSPVLTSPDEGKIISLIGYIYMNDGLIEFYQKNPFITLSDAIEIGGKRMATANMSIEIKSSPQKNLIFNEYKDTHSEWIHVQVTGTLLKRQEGFVYLEVTNLTILK